MATRSTVRIVSNDLPKLRGELRPRAGRIVRATALGIETDAKGRAPVDTGALRASIHTEMTGETSATVAPGVDYAAAVEYGTARGGPAQPYLTPAAEAARPRFVEAMKKLLD